MNERIIHLRVKIKNLADEARTIREEAKKVSGMAKWRLNDHRTGVVRPHARHNLLAYGLLRGIPYEVIEKKCREAPDFATVTRHARQFGATDEDSALWVEEAKAYLAQRKK
jgi:hypothetical protein